MIRFLHGSIRILNILVGALLLGCVGLLLLVLVPLGSILFIVTEGLFVVFLDVWCVCRKVDKIYRRKE